MVVASNPNVPRLYRVHRSRSPKLHAEPPCSNACGQLLAELAHEPHAVAELLVQTMDVRNLAVILSDILVAHPCILKSVQIDLGSLSSRFYRFADAVVQAARSQATLELSNVLAELDGKGVEVEEVVNFQDENGNNPLHICLREVPRGVYGVNTKGTVRLLVEHSCSVNARNRQGETPLLVTARSAALHSGAAVHKSVVDVVKTLLSLRADANARDDHGETPLMEAAWSADLCRVLLDGRADVELASTSNRRAIDFASDDPEVLSLLSERVRKRSHGRMNRASVNSGNSMFARSAARLPPVEEVNSSGSEAADAMTPTLAEEESERHLPEHRAEEETEEITHSGTVFHNLDDEAQIVDRSAVDADEVAEIQGDACIPPSAPVTPFNTDLEQVANVDQELSPQPAVEEVTISSSTVPKDCLQGDQAPSIEEPGLFRNGISLDDWYLQPDSAGWPPSGDHKLSDEPSPGRWICPTCDEVNRSERVQCNNCSSFKPKQSRGLPPADKRLEAVYFGIVDLKYDARRPAGQRLRILELGNGKSSRFSGYGEPILKKFQEEYRLTEPLERSILVDNKKVTHDVFAECDFGHLRPPQVCYPRCYKKSLGKEIAQKLQCDGSSPDCPSAPIVLKLLNRCRGAGVIVANPGDDLETLLQLLLQPSDTQKKYNPSISEALTKDANSMEEQYFHWWSNECPVFVAERCEMSHPLEHGGFRFDATMRVGFVLRRAEEGKRKLEIDFLGGYWKLPAAHLDIGDLRDRIVSKAKSGTAPVSQDDLETVCDDLRQALPDIFAREHVDIEATVQRYRTNSLMQAFTLARQSADVARRELANGKRGSKPMVGKATRLLDRAEEALLENDEDLESFRQKLQAKPPSVRAVVSYIERQRGSWQYRVNAWEDAQGSFSRSLQTHWRNATSEYFKGICHLRQHYYQEAQDAFIRSIWMDPEFKDAYVNFGYTALVLKEWDDAIKASEAGLRRHPAAFRCSYNLGLALAHRVADHLNLKAQGDELSELDREKLKADARRSAEELVRARDQTESRTEWSTKENELLETVGVVSKMLTDCRPIWNVCSQLDTALTTMRGRTHVNFRP